jgi:hypothetical protein
MLLVARMYTSSCCNSISGGHGGYISGSIYVRSFCRDAAQRTCITMKLLTLFVGLSLVVAFVSSAAAVEDDDDVSMVKFKKFKVNFVFHFLIFFCADVGHVT